MFKPKNSECRDFDIVSFNGKLWMIYIRPSGMYYRNNFGLASSADGFTWKYEGVVMKPSKSCWDCKSLWAMHLVKNKNGFVLFYSALGKGGRQNQSIGIAYSKNLYIWKRSKKPILVPSPTNKLYSNEIDKKDKWYPEEPTILFRDPYSFTNKGKKYLIFAGKDKKIKNENNACVGLIEIRKNGTYKYLAPIFSPKKYRIIECPAIYQINKKWFLIFCDDTKNEIKYAVSNNPLGGLKEMKNKPLLPKGNYVGRIIEWKNQYLFFYNSFTPSCLADPKIIKIKNNKIII